MCAPALAVVAVPSRRLHLHGRSYPRFLPGAPQFPTRVGYGAAIWVQVNRHG